MKLTFSAAFVLGLTVTMSTDAAETKPGKKKPGTTPPSSKMIVIPPPTDPAVKGNEPSKVAVDGREFNADPKEKADFDAALGIFRAGQFAQAQTAFADFVKRYPQSGYNASALFWLGNAQYATRNYNEAIANFRSMLSLAPDHAKAPEAVLSIANCQIELKDTKAARRTLEDLTKAYPQSEAAQAGRERLSRLR